MPLFMIERAFAEQLELTDDDVKLIEEINAEEGVRWLFSLPERRPAPHLLPLRGALPGRDHRRRPAGDIPADAVVEVGPAAAAALPAAARLGRGAGPVAIPASPLGDEVHRVRELERAARVAAGEVGVLVADVDEDVEAELLLDPRPLAALVLDRRWRAGGLRRQRVAPGRSRPPAGSTPSGRGRRPGAR